MTAPLRCPICGRDVPPDPEALKNRPFCSLRCKQVDLMRWSDGKYAIVEPHDPSEEAESTKRDDSDEN